jgi:hypothetical protein
MGNPGTLQPGRSGRTLGRRDAIPQARGLRLGLRSARINILLTKHERNMLLLTVVVGIVLLAVFAFVAQALKDGARQRIGGWEKPLRQISLLALTLAGCNFDKTAPTGFGGLRVRPRRLKSAAASMRELSRCWIRAAARKSVAPFPASAASPACDSWPGGACSRPGKPRVRSTSRWCRGRARPVRGSW